VCSTPLHLRAEAGVKLQGKLFLESRAEEMLEAEAEGTVEGLSVFHFMEEALMIRGGRWVLRDCLMRQHRTRRATGAHT